MYFNRIWMEQFPRLALIIPFMEEIVEAGKVKFLV